MEREVVRDQAELVGDLGHLEQVAELHAVRSGRVLQEQRDALPGFLEVDAMVDAVEVDVDVATDRALSPPMRQVRCAAIGVRQRPGRLAHDLDDPRDRREVLPVRHLVAAADQLPMNSAAADR